MKKHLGWRRIIALLLVMFLLSYSIYDVPPQAFLFSVLRAVGLHANIVFQELHSPSEEYVAAGVTHLAFPLSPGFNRICVRHENIPHWLYPGRRVFSKGGYPLVGFYWKSQHELVINGVDSIEEFKNFRISSPGDIAITIDVKSNFSFEERTYLLSPDRQYFAAIYTWRLENGGATFTSAVLKREGSRRNPQRPLRSYQYVGEPDLDIAWTEYGTLAITCVSCKSTEEVLLSYP